MSLGRLAGYLRLVVVTDARLAAPRSVEEVVAHALDAGAGAVQLRNKGDAPRELLGTGRVLRELTRSAGALFFVNDRVDIALALEADGVHLGPDDPPVAAVRAVTSSRFLIGRSAGDPEIARRAVQDGADYIGCGSVYETSTKSDIGGVIGLGGLRSVVEGVTCPVVAIGGITVERAPEVARTGAAGVAVVGAIMSAPDPAAAAKALLAPFRG